MRFFSSILLIASLFSTMDGGDGSKLLHYRPEFHGPLFSVQDQTETDTSAIVPGNERYPARGLILSLVLPGAGQWYAGARKKALIFAGMEAAGLLAWYQFRKRGDDLQLDFEKFADEHWGLKSWVELAPYFYALGEEYHDVIIDGTHYLRINLGNDVIVSSDTLAPPEWEGNIDEITVIRNSEFYENIGKYDQFISGWDDIFDDNGEKAWKLEYKDVGDTVEVIIMTDNKQKYLNLRKKSNRTFQMAGYAVSAIMLNHMISAIDAFWETRRRTIRSPEIDTSVRLLFSPYSRFGVGGISFSISW